jgi:hypothetical protein
MSETPKQKTRNDRIVSLYTKSNLPITKIAPRVGICSSAVLRVLVNRRVPRKPNGWNNPDELPHNKARNDRIVALYTKNNLSTTQISKRIPGITPSGICYILKIRRVRPKPNGWYPKPTPEYSLRIRAYAKSIAPLVGEGPGCSAAALARAGGFKPATLRIHLRALGVPMRPGLGDDNVKLNKDQVLRIKAALVGGRTTQAALATRYNVGTSTIWAIADSQTWTHIPWPNNRPYKPHRRPAKRRSAPRSAKPPARRPAPRKRRR